VLDGVDRAQGEPCLCAVANHHRVALVGRGGQVTERDARDPELRQQAGQRALDHPGRLERPAVDGAVGADLDVVADDDLAGLRDLDVPPLDQAIAEAGAAEDGAGVDLDAVAALDLVVQDDRVILKGCHRALDGRPHALVACRGNPLLAELLAFELQLEAVVVLSRRRALQDRTALEHLHANVALVLHRLRHEHVVKRVEHLALVRGRVEVSQGKIDAPVARDPSNRKRMAVVTTPTARAAISSFRVIESLQDYTLLQVEPQTGRTHQIRVHLAWLKHPVVGDEVYGGGRDKTVSDPKLRSRIAKLGRPFLHAEQLGFRHPRTSEELRFTVSLPPELEELISETS